MNIGNRSIDHFALIIGQSTIAIFGHHEVCDLAGGVPVVVISVRERAEDVHQAIKAGASGYIPKSSNPNVMINALKLVLSGGIYIPPHVLQLTSPSDEAASAGVENLVSSTTFIGRRAA